MISIEAKARYLVLHDVGTPGPKRILLEKSLELCVENWTSGSRVSPCWPIKGTISSDVGFSGSQTLLFVGPIQPAELFTAIEGILDAPKTSAWVTAGCFNVVLCVDHEAKEKVTKIKRWANNNTVAYEAWVLDDGIIKSVVSRPLSGEIDHASIKKLSKNAKSVKNDFLKPALQENVIASATGLTRSFSVHRPSSRALDKVIDAMNGVFDAHGKGIISTLDFQARMLSMNAAMSRFSSQAFSGVPPIQATECHFWVHSLLGTGSANIALNNLTHSIQQVLGEAKIPERLEKLSEIVTDVPDNKELVMGNKVLRFDLFKSTEGSKISGKPVVPLVNYFSGRDGFSSQVQTLSAPLSTIAECNSYRSNILTATHELSHIFVQSALGVLYPNLDSQRDIDEAKKATKVGFKASNHLEAAKKLVIEAVVMMEQAKRAKSNQTLNSVQVSDMLPAILSRWRHEMQEIMVHSFDFLYFHKGNADFYVTSIWHSWCAIPGIADRVPEYLLRTICAVSADILDALPQQIFDSAVRSTKELLETVDSQIDPQNDYVSIALERIEDMEKNDDLKNKIRQEFEARKYLVRLVKIYLHSEKLENDLFDDHSVRSAARQGNKTALRYDTNHIGNPLTFLRKQLKANPSEAESLWVLHCLAFDLFQREGDKP